MWAPSPGWRPTVRTWLSVLALGLVLWLIVRHTSLIFEVLAVLFAAYLLSLAIAPLADLLARGGIPRAIAVLLFYALVLGVVALVGRLLLPVIHMETLHLRRHLPAILDRALSALRSTPLLQEWLPSNETLAQMLTQNGNGFLRPAFGAVLDVGGLALDLVVVLVLAFFFVTDQTIGERLLFNWIPDGQKQRARRISARLHYRLTRWIWAQFIVALYFAVSFSTVLALLHIPFAFTIGLIGGLLELVPYFGGFIAFTLAVLSALSVNPILVLWIAVLYVIVIEIEGHVLAPALYGKATGLHPAAVLIALFIGAKAAGLPGVLFAVPTAVVIGTLLGEAQSARQETALAPAPRAESTRPPLTEMEKP